MKTYNWNDDCRAYMAKAVVAPSLNANTAMRLNRIGGQVRAAEVFDSYFMPTYVAEERMREEYPDCNIVIIPSRAWKIQQEALED